MHIKEWTDDKIQTLIDRYHKKDIVAGGVYSLRELLLEQMRRKQDQIQPRDVAAKIINLAGAAKDGVVTYGELWHEFWPTKEWKGNYSKKIMSNLLDTVIAYCVTNHLPLVSMLVVRQDSREIADNAIKHIAIQCKELGIDVGLLPERFVKEQMKLSKALSLSSLPP
jgi:hypothetical protein